MPNALRILLVVFFLICGRVTAAGADVVYVAVASNFLKPARTLAANFEQSTGHTLKLIGGSTGKLFAQIVHGAPYDVFLAADHHHPRLLAERGLADESTQFTYAVGRLTLWSARPGWINGEGDTVLRGGEFHHLALANPKTAPYGKAALQVLKHLKLDKTLQPRLVYGENIGQAFQFVATGNAELGFVALSQVLDPKQTQPGSRWDVPENLHDPLRQDATLLDHGASKPGARAWLAFLKLPESRDLIQTFGYSLQDPGLK